MTLNLFAPLAMKVTGGIIAALLVALAIVMWRADAISEARDKAHRDFVTEQARHAVTTASLNSLTQRLEAMVRDGELRRERLDTAIQQVERQTAPLRDQADALDRGEIDISQVEGL